MSQNKSIDLSGDGNYFLTSLVLDTADKFWIQKNSKDDAGDIFCYESDFDLFVLWNSSCKCLNDGISSQNCFQLSGSQN